MKKLLGSWRVDVAVRGKCIYMSIVEMHVLTFDNERKSKCVELGGGREGGRFCVDPVRT